LLDTSRRRPRISDLPEEAATRVGFGIGEGYIEAATTLIY
jgi:hypothetical protein